jgi:hypothetical protein
VTETEFDGGWGDVVVLMVREDRGWISLLLLF